MAKSWSQILRDTSPRHACLGEVSRESASRQSRELIMKSERTTNVWRGGRRESQAALSQLISISLFLEGEGGWELAKQ